MTTAQAITNTMEPYLPGKLGILTVGNNEGCERVYARRLENGDAGLPTADQVGIVAEACEWPVVNTNGECITVDVKTASFGCVVLSLEKDCSPETSVLVNRARLDWQYPRSATAGETLRLFGRNLVDLSQYQTAVADTPVSYGGFVDAASKVVVRRQGTRAFIQLKVKQASGYELAVHVPEGITGGDYEVFVHNGLGGAAGWSEPLRVSVTVAEPWPQTVYWVDDYLEAGMPSCHVKWNIAGITADTDGENFADDAIEQALRAAAENGGGIVTLSGRIYDTSRPIIVPPRVVLRGQGSSRTWIRTPRGLKSRPPFVVITGDRDFVVEDIRIITFFAPVAIAVPSWLPQSYEEAMSMKHLSMDGLEERGENVSIRRCVIQQRLYEKMMRRWTHPDCDDETRTEVAKLCSVDAFLENNEGGRNVINAVMLRGDSLELIDCTVAGAQHSVSLAGCSYTRIAGNTLEAGMNGNAMQMYGQLRYDHDASGRPFGAEIHGFVTERMLIEDNLMQGADARSHNGFFFFQSGVCSHVARNTIRNISRATDGEACGWHHFMNRYKNVNIRMVSPLEGELVDPEHQFDGQILEGMAIEVMDGPGVGQLRNILKRDGNGVTLDNPWGLVPAADSFVTFSAPSPFHKLVFVDNSISNSGPSFCLWGSCNDVMIDGNHIADGPGITMWSVRHDEIARGRWGGPKFLQVINNTLDVGMCFPDEKRIIDCDAASIAEHGLISTAASFHEADIPKGLDYLGLMIRSNVTKNNTAIMFRKHFEPPIGSGRKPINALAAGIVIEDNRGQNSEYGIILENCSEVVVRGNRAENVTHPMAVFDLETRTVSKLTQQQ